MIVPGRLDERLSTADMRRAAESSRRASMTTYYLDGGEPATVHDIARRTGLDVQRVALRIKHARRKKLPLTWALFGATQ